MGSAVLYDGYNIIDLTEEVPVYLSHRHTFDEEIARMKSKSVRLMDVSSLQTLVGERARDTVFGLGLKNTDQVTVRSIAGTPMLCVEFPYQGVIARVIASKWYLYYGVPAGEGKYTYYRNEALFKRSIPKQQVPV